MNNDPLRDFLSMNLCDMNPCPDCLKIVRKEVARSLDWNLSESRILNYRVTPDNRLQVAISFKLGSFDADDVRDFLSKVTELSDQYKIDLLIIQNEKLCV